MREMIIKKNDAGQRLDRFIMKAVPLLPGTLSQKYIRLKRIKVNGKRTERSYHLEEGDIIQLYINDEFFDTPKEEGIYLSIQNPQLDIAYEDDNLLVVSKSPGTLCHSGGEPAQITLVDQVKAYLYLSGQWKPRLEQSFTPAICNRLDRNTGGLVIAAKSGEALRLINEKISSREIDKYYLAAVHGVPCPAEGRVEGSILKNSRLNKVQVLKAHTRDAKEAVTEYRTLETKEKLSLVELRLLTGRTHQIRAQMAAIGSPLLGDVKYGGEEINLPYGMRHQALWAYRIRFAFKTDGGALNYLKNKEILSPKIDFLLKYFDYRI